MKKPVSITAVLFLTALTALAQGTVNFSTRVVGVIVAHVYGLETPPHGPDEFWRLSGNTASETPTGTQVYTGALLTGTGFSAQLFGGPLGSTENDLVAIGGPTPFRTGAALRGTPAPQALVVPFILPGGSGTFQIRAWDNAGGTLTSWFQSISTINRGASALFTIDGLGDGVITSPADMVNFRSFSFGNTDPIPEPGMYALFGLGAFGLWSCRCKKPSI